MLAVDFIARGLDAVKKSASEEIISKTFGGAIKLGHCAVFAAVALTLICGIRYAITFRSVEFFLGGVILGVVLFVGQFAADRFLGLADRLVANTPSRLSAHAFCEVTGLLLLVSAAGVLLGGIVFCVKLGTASMLPPVIVGAVLLAILGVVALQPRMLGVEHNDDASTVEEVFGLIFYLLKIGMKLIPIFFGAITLVGAYALLTTIFKMNNASVEALAGVTGIPSPFTGVGVTLFACLLPLAAWLWFLLNTYLLNVIRAVLVFLEKVDRYVKKD
jgi:hypothetical protein